MEHEEQHSGRFSIIPTLAVDDPRMTPALLKLLCVLGSYGDKYGYCRPKLTTLAHRMGHITKQAVSKNLQQLKALGWVEILPQYASDGGRAVNHYRILFDHRPNNGAPVDGGQLPEVDGGQLPEVDGGQLPEVDALNAPYERPIRTLSAAAALSNPRGEEVDGSTDVAAAAWDLTTLKQTAEAIRVRLDMPLRNLDGLMDILRQYPEAPAYFIAQAAACREKLRVRPLRLSHFASYVERSEMARERAARASEGENHHEHTATTSTPDATGRHQARTAQAQSERRAQLLAAVMEKHFGPLDG